MTMTKTLLYAILLSTACQASAATLYRWIEPDGSITFSPEPPTTEVEYETVETGAAATSANQAARDSQIAPSTPEPVNTATAELPNELPVTRLQPTEPIQALSYAPGADAPRNQIVRADTRVAAVTIQDANVAQENNADVVGSSQKYEQCQDLRKRVVSLEQRLRVDLTPDEVDNTVLAIVRYQDSFDQFCL